MLLSCLPPEICVYKDVIVSWMHHRRHPSILCSDCYDRASWTLFSFIYPFLSPYLLYHGHPPFAPCYRLELDLPSNTKTGTRCLADCVLPLPLSITRSILIFAVLLMRASVPADVHPSCPLCARISSPSPYVSLHPLCTLPDPLTCVIPRPLYALS